jgi:hypothetical protein
VRHAVLRGGTACFVLADDPAGAQPVLLHWGPDLGADLDVAALRTAAAPPLPRSSYAVDTPRRVVAVGADGWRGRPTLRGARTDGSGTSPRLLASQWEAGPDRVRVSVADEAVGLAVETTYRMHASGVLETSTTVHNTGASPFALAELSVSLPLPAGRPSCSSRPAGGVASEHRNAWTSATALASGRAGTARRGTTHRSSSRPVPPASAGAAASSGRCTSGGAATRCTGPNGTPQARRRSEPASSWRLARSSSSRGRATPPRRCTPSTARPGWMASAVRSTTSCGRGQATRRTRGRWSSTPGRRCTSTTGSTG